MRYWHKASNIQAQKLLDSNATIKEFMEQYSQPDWCGYPDALEGEMGCWSLTSFKLRKRISPKFCKSCDCFKLKEK